MSESKRVASRAEVEKRMRQASDFSTLVIILTELLVNANNELERHGLLPK